MASDDPNLAKLAFWERTWQIAIFLQISVLCKEEKGERGEMAKKHWVLTWRIENWRSFSLVTLPSFPGCTYFFKYGEQGFLPFGNLVLQIGENAVTLPIIQALPAQERLAIVEICLRRGAMFVFSYPARIS